jgi:drug/metabolite transporter (DMT)-like permease
MPDKLKQVIALLGGFLGALLLFLRSVGISFDWFNEDTIGTFISLITACAAFLLACYGVYKNSYLLSDRAKLQEEILKKKGLK